MSLARLFAVASAFMLAVPAAFAQEQGPSYSCSTAELEAEITVCESRRLSRLDRRMDELYREARRAAKTGRERRRIRREQFDWLNERNACESGRRCLRRRYEERIAVLENSDAGDDFADENPSFSCRNAQQDAERAICRSERLSRLDRELAALYEEVRSEVTGWRLRRKLVRSQKSWVRTRNECGRDRRCIRRAYQTRIDALNDYKQELIPAYQRTSMWRSNCERPAHETMAVTCGSERLWRHYSDMRQAYDNALRSGSQTRRWAKRSQRDWNDEWETCGRNERCIRRQLSDRTAELRRRIERGTRKPDYKRSEFWQATCRNTSDTVLRTTCNSEQLWKLHIEMLRVYDRTLKWSDTYGVRQYIAADQQQWDRKLRRCRSRVECQRRAYRDRIAELQDRGYRRRHSDRNSATLDQADENYRRTAKWQHVCLNVKHVATQTSCGSRELWGLYIAMLQEEQLLYARIHDNRVRLAMNRLRDSWEAQWRSCGANKQCQRQSYRQRLIELRDPAYLSVLRDSGATQQQQRQRKNDFYGANSDTR